MVSTYFCIVKTPIHLNSPLILLLPCVTDDDAEPKIFDYEMDIDHPFWNKGGVVPILAKNVSVENNAYQCEKFVLRFPHIDPVDFAAQRFSAVIYEDRTGVVVTMPGIPHSSTGRKEANGKNSKCDVTKKVHLSKIVSCAEEDVRILTREVYWSLPKRNGEQMRCSNKYFNTYVICSFN
jgi:hypothetical protein